MKIKGRLNYLVIIFVLLYVSIECYAQPYLFEHFSEYDSSNQLIFPEVVERYNLSSNSKNSLLSFDETRIYQVYWVPTQQWIAIEIPYLPALFVNTQDSTISIEVPDELSGLGGGLLYSKIKNKIFYFNLSEDSEQLVSIELTTKVFDTLLVVPYSENQTLGNREAFLSLNEDVLYFNVADTTYPVTVNDKDFVHYFSTVTNQVIQKRRLYEFGYPNADGYLLHRGRKGKAIVESFYRNQTADSYYRLYDFDHNIGSGYIFYQGYTTPYFTGNGEYLVLPETIDSSHRELNTGKFFIYNLNTSSLVKTVTLPARGESFTFDNYPNNIYYIVDFYSTERQIYTLKIDSIFNELDLSSLTPSSVNVNSPAFILTVKGKGFDTVSTVYYNGQAKTTTFISDSVLTAEILATDVSVAGTFPVWVRDEWAVSDTLQFIVQASSPNLLVNLKTSTGTLLTTGSLQFYEGSWKDAVNNGDGTFTVITNLNSVSLRMTYEYASQTVSNITAHNNTYTFTTVNAAVQLKNSLGNLIDVGTVQYYSGAWRSFGTTTNGVATKELLPINYSFRMTYEYASIDKQQNLSVDPTVVFQTVNAQVQLKNSLGNLIDVGTVQYYAGAWRSFGTTASGVATKELLPINYSFRMTHAFLSKDKQQNISTNSVVDFTTVLCSVKVSNSQNQPLNNANVKYYAGAWRDLGVTNSSGITTKEVLPQNISFRASYGNISLDKQQDIGVNSLVEILMNVP